MQGERDTGVVGPESRLLRRTLSQLAKFEIKGSWGGEGVTLNGCVSSGQIFRANYSDEKFTESNYCYCRTCVRMDQTFQRPDSKGNCVSRRFMSDLSLEEISSPCKQEATVGHSLKNSRSCGRQFVDGLFTSSSIHSIGLCIAEPAGLKALESS